MRAARTLRYLAREGAVNWMVEDGYREEETG